MKQATITEAKNGLSALLDQVKAGQSIVILDRGVPVARIEPIAARPEASSRIRRLERAGAMSIGDGVPPLELLKTPPPPLAAGGSVVEALLEERRSGR
ncbi:MAG: type II toxin-antitoxin system prevent-host-death family antitoxin [Chloroflexota bacterium]